MTPSNLILEAEYVDIIITLMSPPYNISSITKLIFISFGVRHEKDIRKYQNRKKNFIDTFLGGLLLKLLAHDDEFRRILRVIEMLEENLVVLIDEDSVYLNRKIEFQTEDFFLKFCAGKEPNPIIEVDRLDPQAIVEEVLQYV